MLRIPTGNLEIKINLNSISKHPDLYITYIILIHF